MKSKIDTIYSKSNWYICLSQLFIIQWKCVHFYCRLSLMKTVCAPRSHTASTICTWISRIDFIILIKYRECSLIGCRRQTFNGLFWCCCFFSILFWVPFALHPIHWMWFYGDELMIYRLFMAKTKIYEWSACCTATRIYIVCDLCTLQLFFVVVIVISFVHSVYFPTFQEVPCHSLIIHLPYIEIDHFIYQLLASIVITHLLRRCVCH